MTTAVPRHPFRTDDAAVTTAPAAASAREAVQGNRDLRRRPLRRAGADNLRKIVAFVGGTPLKVNDGSNGKDMYGYDAEAMKQEPSPDADADTPHADSPKPGPPVTARIPERELAAVDDWRRAGDPVHGRRPGDAGWRRRDR